jgi:hypothetical protein
LKLWFTSPTFSYCDIELKGSAIYSATHFLGLNQRNNPDSCSGFHEFFAKDTNFSIDHAE